MKAERVQKKRKKRRDILIKLGITLAVLGAAFLVLSSSLFNVTSYEVYGSTYYTESEILTMGNCRTGVNMFVGIDADDITSRLTRDPYISAVKISRKYPDTVVIRIDGRTQVAALVVGEKYVVIDDSCLMLRSTTIDPKVTIIRGLTLSKMTLGNEVLVEETALLRQAMDIIDAAGRNDIYFVSLDMAGGNIRGHILDNLICEGTYDNFLSSIEKNYLQLAVKELFDRDIERGVIKIAGDNYISYSPKLD